MGLLGGADEADITLVADLLGNQVQLELLFDYASEEAAHRVLLPVGGVHDCCDGGALRLLQHLQHSRLF